MGRTRKIGSMPNINELDTPTAARFFAVLEELYPSSNRRYDCHVLSDLDYSVLGIMRCISHAKTGHEFLQHHAEHGGRDENADLFFKALKSKRRLQNLTSLNEALAPVMSAKLREPIAHSPELKGYHFYAADGHYQHAACFDPRKSTSKGLQKIATGHFFRCNLFTHHLSYLDLSRPGDGKKNDHDANVINRAKVETLRSHAKTGEKVVYFWDKACIDYGAWSRFKRSGIYFVTREKSNSAMKTMSIERFDPTAPRNAGIQSDTLVGNSNGETLRRVIYRDPADDKEYIYLTNEMQLPAWAIALGYKHRWDIEWSGATWTGANATCPQGATGGEHQKIFDQFKNKMEETKSWASSDVAKEAHAWFQCIAHNLVLLFEGDIKRDEGMQDKVEAKKKSIRTKTRTNREGTPLKQIKNFINQAIQRATQRTVRFIRWLRTWLYRRASWRDATARLAKVWDC